MGHLKFFYFVGLVVWGGSLAHAESFRIKPYLHTIKGESWAVSWAPTSPRGYHSTVTLTQNGRVADIDATLTDGVYTSILPLPKCDFGEVTYKVPLMAETLKINSIPCPERSEATRFSFLADTQEGQNHDRVFAKEIAKFNGAAVLIGGDLVETGADVEEWTGFFDALSSVLQNQILIPVIGNHEYHGNRDVPLWKRFFQTEAAEDFYAIDIGPVHVMAINSCFTDEPTLKLKQLEWLESELAKPSLWRVVFFHHPPFSRSIMNSHEYPKKEWKILQQDYVPLFEDHHVDLVLNGHVHLYEHSQKAGVQYLTVGPAGGVMGIHGSKNSFTTESRKIRTIVEIEATPHRLRAISLTITGNQVGEIILAK